MDWHRIDTVVVPVDLDDEGRSGLALALEAVADPSGIHVIYVVPDLEPSLTLQIGEARRRANATESLGTWLSQQGAPDGIHLQVRIGDPAPVIVELAKEVKADLVILPSRGRRGIARAMMGSVAERVARLAPCAVLILKEPPRAASTP